MDLRLALLVDERTAVAHLLVCSPSQIVRLVFERPSVQIASHRIEGPQPKGLESKTLAVDARPDQLNRRSRAYAKVLSEKPPGGSR